MNDIITETKDSEQKKLLSPIDMAYIGMFTALITVCSWISIPTTIPFTLQTFAVFLTVALIGTKRSFISVIIYILLGAVGLPVFSGFKGGPAAFAGPTGGFLLGFLAAALVYWLLEKLVFARLMTTQKKKIIFGFVISVIFELIMYTVGVIWFMTVYAAQTGPVGLVTVLGWCVIPFIIPDIVKMAAAVIISSRASRFVRQ